MNTTPYAQRRMRLAAMIEQNDMIIIPGAQDVPRNSDMMYPFRQDSSFQYLAGFPEPDAFLVILGTGVSYIFCNPKDPVAELWLGPRMGPQAAAEQFDFERGFSNAFSEAENILRELIGSAASVYIRTETRRNEMRCDPNVKELRAFLGRLQAEGMTFALKDSAPLVTEMRVIKDAYDITGLQHAAEVTAAAYDVIPRLIREGMSEYELAAAISYLFGREGGDQLNAYHMIVASGVHATTLHHYAQRRALFQKGQSILIDAGAEVDGYASDVTRVYPVDRKFTPAQAELYDLVLAAQLVGIREVKPGVSLYMVQDASARVLTQGLIDVGLISTRDLGAAMEQRSYREFFPHGIGHFLGLDVHDVGDYEKQEHNGRIRQEVVLRAGMVLTVEPGVYVSDKPDVPEVFRGIGVRIEDNVLVAHTGCAVLTQGIPKDRRTVERIMGKTRLRLAPH